MSIRRGTIRAERALDPEGQDEILLGTWGDEWIVTKSREPRSWIGHTHTRHAYYKSKARWGRESFYQYTTSTDGQCSCGAFYPKEMKALADTMNFWDVRKP